MASQPSSDFGVGIEHQYRAAYFADVIERRGGVDLEVELENPFEIVQRFFRKNNHESLRGVGRGGFSPPALPSRYSKTSSAGTPRPDFRMRASRRLASA